MRYIERRYMSEIIKLANQLKSDNIELCERCLGRLFGKLGHNLDNLSRGRVIKFLLLLSEQLKKEITIKDQEKHSVMTENNRYLNLNKLLNEFDFPPDLTSLLLNIINPINNPETTIGSLKNNYDTKDMILIKEQIEKILGTEKLNEIVSEIAINYDNQNHKNCYVCKGLFDELPAFSKLVNNAVSKFEFNDFLIGCKLDNDLVTTEEELWSKYGFKHPEPMKSEFNRELGKIVEPKLDKKVNFNTPDITIIVDTRYDNINLQISSLFIYGRYKKFVRDLPQTRWPCKRCWGSGCKKCNGTGKVYPTSVEEEVAVRVMDRTFGKAHYFHGMGREDIGVRMLGNGRPFILEITEPTKRDLDLTKLQEEINKYAEGKVEVLELKFTNHNAVRELKAAKPDKTYNVKVNFDKKIDIGKLKGVISTLSGRTIKQRTPIRVSHRRADLVRNRILQNMDLIGMFSDGIGAEIEITGESGLYIKELITGDSGRTVPSLASELGIECVVQELDVLQINDNER